MKEYLKKSFKKIAVENNEIFDDPVIEYCVQIAMDLFEIKDDKYELIDDSGVDTMVETLNGFFTRQITDLKDKIRHIFFNIASNAYLNHLPNDSENNTEIKTEKRFEIINEETNEKEEFVSNLNPNAPCFYLPEKKEVSSYDAFIKQYSSNVPLNKSDIDMLYCLFPGYSMDTLKRFYQSQNSSLSSTITLLLNFDIDPDAFQNYMLSLESSYYYEALGEKNKVSVDFSETNFPSLPQNNINQNNRKYDSDSITNSEKKFSDIVKMQNNKTGYNDDNLNIKNQNYQNVDMRNYLLTNGWSDSSKRINIPWVETGKEVSEQYEILRKEASQFASLRNTCFENATKAFVMGKKAMAKELGIEGRMYNEKMKDCHIRASDAIFEERNKKLKEKMNTSDIVFDLHGLHMVEAKRILQREINVLKQKKPSGRLKPIKLLVGTGHHTKGSKRRTKLPEAVIDYLNENNYKHNIIAPGVIEIIF